MKTSIIAKIGISMLVMLIAVGTASADGGSSYDNAEMIVVPEGDIDIWTGDYNSDGWYKFHADYNDEVFVEIDNRFYSSGGTMRLHDGEGNIQAEINGLVYDTTGVVQTSYPRIEINDGTYPSYKFVAGRNFEVPEN